MKSSVKSYYHKPTFAWTHLLSCQKTAKAALIDPVLDYMSSGAKWSSEFIDQILQDIDQMGLDLELILETHAHADHVSSADYIRRKTNSKIVIGEGIQSVQNTFKSVFNFDTSFACDGSQFDVLLKDKDVIVLGELEIVAMHTPGHTCDSMTYIVENKAFIGDTMFSPDYGTARCDFPGGDAETLYDSVQKILSLGDSMTLYLCHDYPGDNRTECSNFLVMEQKQNNIHINDTIERDDFVSMRQQRDQGLSPPALIIPSIQLNINAGALPEPEPNGTSYLKFPLNRFAK